MFCLDRTRRWLSINEIIDLRTTTGGTGSSFVAGFSVVDLDRSTSNLERRRRAADDAESSLSDNEIWTTFFFSSVGLFRGSCWRNCVNDELQLSLSSRKNKEKKMIDVKVCLCRRRTSVWHIFQPVTIGDGDDAMVLVDVVVGMNLFNEFDGDKPGLSSAIVGSGDIVGTRYSNCSWRRGLVSKLCRRRCNLFCSNFRHRRR